MPNADSPEGRLNTILGRLHRGAAVVADAAARHDPVGRAGLDGARFLDELHPRCLDLGERLGAFLPRRGLRDVTPLPPGLLAEAVEIGGRLYAYAAVNAGLVPGWAGAPESKAEIERSWADFRAAVALVERYQASPAVAVGVAANDPDAGGAGNVLPFRRRVA